MQPAHYRSREHERTRHQSMAGRRFRGLHIFLRRIRHTRSQRVVTTPTVVMGRPLSQNRTQMCFRHRNYPIEAFSSYCPDHALESSGGDLRETWIPSFTNSSLAMRSSPHSGFSAPILRIRLRSSGGIGSRPALHFQRQKIRQPMRCQRTMVAGRTMTTVSRQSNSLVNSARLTRVA
jgi:hypothetical protein